MREDDSLKINQEMMSKIPGGEREKKRYQTLLETLTPWKHLIEGKKSLDFGASWGTSVVAMSTFGAREVIGVEPDKERVDKGIELINAIAPQRKLSIVHAPDTSKLPFDSGTFDFILANAVLEHIPQPRQPYIQELWRILAIDGILMINETPNKYFPYEGHTTQLWFNHWLPKHIAYKRAIRHERFDISRTDWDSSGWRGMGYFEMIQGLSGFSLVPEVIKLRHRFFNALGIPASIIDPYPTWIIRKVK